MSTNYVRILRSRWKAIIALCLIGIAAGWVTAPRKTSDRQYRIFAATHILLADTSASQPGTGAAAAARTLEPTALLLTVGEVPARAAATLGTDVDKLVPAVLTRTDPVAGTIRITVADPDGAGAARVADTLASELLATLDRRAKERHKAELDEANAQLTAARRDLDALPLEPPRTSTTPADPAAQALRDSVLRRFETASARVADLQMQPPPTSGFVSIQSAKPFPVDRRDVQAARRQAAQGQSATRSAGSAQTQTLRTLPPETQQVDSGPGRIRRAVLGGVVGMALGLAFALLRERLDARVRDRRDVQKAFALPVVAEVPRLSRRRRRRPSIALGDKRQAAAAEAYRLLRTVLLRSDLPVLAQQTVANTVGEASGNGQTVVPHSPKAILVVSAGAREGRTTVVANLAAAIAEAGRTVVVVDVDGQRAPVSQLLGTKSGAGGEDAAQGVEPTSNGLVEGAHRATRLPGVRLVVDGSATASLATTASALVARARDGADVVLVDAPPLLASNRASDILPLVDGVLVVSFVDRTSMSTAGRAAERLELLRAPVLGVVLLNASVPRTGYMRERAVPPAAVVAPVAPPRQEALTPEDEAPPAAAGAGAVPASTMGMTTPMPEPPAANLSPPEQPAGGGDEVPELVRAASSNGSSGSDESTEGRGEGGGGKEAPRPKKRASVTKAAARRTASRPANSE